MAEKLRHAPDPASTHFYSSSGGNAGLACVVAAQTLRAAATVVVPLSTSAYMMGKIEDAGAIDVIQIGASWAEADAHLRDVIMPEAESRGENAVYVHPFDEEEIWEGHSALITEIEEQMHGFDEPADVVVCSVGGGGLINGIMLGLKRMGMSKTEIVAVETNGADAFAQSLAKGELVTLPAITSIATTLGARRVSSKTLELANRWNPLHSMVLEDRQAVEGCAYLAETHRFLVEAACGVCIGACMTDEFRKLSKTIADRERRKPNVVIIVCGGSNMNSETLESYKKEYLQA